MKLGRGSASRYWDTAPFLEGGDLVYTARTNAAYCAADSGMRCVRWFDRDVEGKDGVTNPYAF
jgi:hypothetical protein